MDLLFHKPLSDIERILSTLSASDRELVMKQFLESMKVKSETHQESRPSASSEGFSKRTLQSPETPNKGGSRKVYPF
jgi:hypothetical protein